jgi:hypothetical protein
LTAFPFGGIMSSDNALVKSKERVDEFGEVFTPYFLIQQMLDLFPDDSWGKSKNWLEPTCGNGNFILAILKRKIEKGFSIEEALATTYGMDIMPDNVAECKKRIFDEVIKPAFSKNGKLPKSKINDVLKCLCIATTNIRHTPNSLTENWSQKWDSYLEMSTAEQLEILAQVKKTLGMK